MQDEEGRIREIAHLLWQTSGRPSGMAERHWRQAREIFEAEKAAFAKQAPSFPVSSPSRQTMEAHMRNFDELVADAQKALAHSLREAFDAGRAHTASELKHRMAALFEDLISGPVAPHGAPAGHEGAGHEGGQGEHSEPTSG